MPPRLRSRPYGPDSPNAPQALPDPPRRRRATRSASAQPQDDQPAQPAREVKPRKARGKAASRSKKKTTSRTSPSPQPERLEGDESISGAVAEPHSGQETLATEVQDPIPATPSVEVPVTVIPSIETGDSELRTPDNGGLRSAGTAANRRPRRRLPGTSPSSTSEQSHVLRAQGASPIHRRRNENRGSFGRTLYRLPQLLTLRDQLESQNDQEKETNPTDEQVSLTSPLATAVPESDSPMTPEPAPPATPVAPTTAPPTGTDVSSGWSRWIFNSVSRRWTVLRGRFGHHDIENENQPAAAAESAGSAKPTSSAVAPASPAEAVSGSSVAPTASPTPSKRSAHSAVERAQIMPSSHRDLPPSNYLPLPRRRRRATSFVDTRSLLFPDAPTGPGYETQHEFVKRRQAARFALEKEKREARIRQETEAKYAAAAARDAARRRQNSLSLVSNTQSPTRTHARSSTSSPRSPSSHRTPTSTKPSNPLKRSRGFGLDEDELAVHEDDFTPEEWEALKAQVEKAEEEAAKAAQESFPPPKKRRVDTSPQQKRHRQPGRRQTTESTRSNGQNQHPSRTPGFVPNSRGTLAKPDLSPIDSSRLLSDPDSPLTFEIDPTARDAIKNHKEEKRFGPIMGTIVNAPTDNAATDADADSTQGPSPLTRARNKAEQFKPKTPSRLRESARIPSSNTSTPSILGNPSPSFQGVSSSNSPYRSDPMSVDGSSFVGHSDANPAAIADSISTDSRGDDVSSLRAADNGTGSQTARDFGTEASATTAVARVSENAVDEAVSSEFADIAWLLEMVPNGDFNQLKWPPPKRLTEVLNCRPGAEGIVDKNWQEKGDGLVRYFETLL